jgi:hypothetical protein
MKKLWILFMFLPMFLFMVSCEKESQLSDNSIQNGVSNPDQYSLGKFKREIILKDETGQSTLFVAIHSDYESAIDEYLAEYELKLSISDISLIQDLKKSAEVNETIQTKVDKKAPSIDPEHSVIVEIVNSNIIGEDKAYLLDVTKKATLTKDFQTGTYADYMDASDFAGVVHKGTGYDIYVSTNFKNTFLSFWTNVYTGYLYSSFYYAYVDKPNSYRVAIGVYLDARQTTQNYQVVFTKDNFRSRTCSLGTYDYNEFGQCYVGTTPTGTTPFVWGPDENSLAFYHMPLSGNNCPMPGSWFDGYSCYIVAIPEGTEWMTWQNHMMVKSEKILD